MYFSQTWQEIFNWTRAFADVIIVWFILYYAIKVVRNNSRTIQIFKGIVLILIVNWLANFLGLSTISWLAGMFVSYGFLAIIVIFQPEIRGLLEKLGKSNVLSKLSTLSGNEKEKLVDEIEKAVVILSQEQTGALITLEQGQSLTDYISTGTPMNSLVTAELLTTIFVPYTPLHDGAVIIQGDRLACASAYFPPTNLELPNKYGARHRAAIGISEITDSITIVISEETGSISISEGGKIRKVSVSEMKKYLLRVLCNQEIEVKKEKKNSIDRKAFYVVDEPVEVVNKEDAQPTMKEERVGLFGRLAVRRQSVVEKDELSEDSIEIKIPKNKNKRKGFLSKNKKDTTLEEKIEETTEVMLNENNDDEGNNSVENIEVIETKIVEDKVENTVKPYEEVEVLEENNSVHSNKDAVEDIDNIYNAILENNKIDIDSNNHEAEEALEIIVPENNDNSDNKVMETPFENEEKGGKM